MLKKIFDSLVIGNGKMLIAQNYQRRLLVPYELWHHNLYVGKEHLTCTIPAKNTIKCADNTTKWYSDEPP